MYGGCIIMQPDATRSSKIARVFTRLPPTRQTQTGLPNEPNLALCFQQNLQNESQIPPGKGPKTPPLAVFF
jgi:hypothetical protein